MDLQTRNQYMKAMGIPVWLPRADVIEAGEVAAASNAQAAVIDASPAPTAQPPMPSSNPSNHSTSTRKVTPPPVELSQLFNDAPAPVTAPTQLSSPHTAINSDVALAAPDCSTMDWSTLQSTVSNCQLCTLHKSRNQTVFGTGDQQADWMIVGEAPGANEDRQGEPFVGRAGQLLNNMLAAVGLPRNAIYISNVLKCRPPNNRDPKAEESALCRGYLERQIELIKPALIIVVGRIAAHNLLQVTTPLGRLRNQLHQLPGSNIPVIVTYHPAYLLRQPAEKRKAWQDLQLARQVMRER